MQKLIVFRKNYEYLFWLKPTVERFAKVHKYSLGTELQGSAIKLLRLIIKANYSDSKADPIKKAIVEYEVQRLLLRLSFDYKLLNKRQYEYAVGKLEEIDRLLKGWLRRYCS